MSNTKKLAVYLPLELHAALTREANRERRSMTSQAVYLLERALSNSALLDALPNDMGTCSNCNQFTWNEWSTNYDGICLNCEPTLNQ